MLKPLAFSLALALGSLGWAPQTAPRPAPKPKPGVDAPGVKIPVERLTPIATFDIPGAPDWMVIDDKVWVSNAPKNSVTEIDPGTNRIVETIASGSRPCSGLAAGFGSVWVPNCGDKTLARIDV